VAIEDLEKLFVRESWDRLRPLFLAMYASPHGRLAKGVAKFLARSPVVDIIALKAVIGHAGRGGLHFNIMRRVNAVLDKYPDRVPLHYRVKYLAFANEVASVVFGRKGKLSTIPAIRSKYVARGADPEILDEIVSAVLRA